MVTPLNKSDFFLSQQLSIQIAYWIGAKLCTHLSFSMLEFSVDWIYTDLVYAVIVYISSHMLNCFLQTLFPLNDPLPLALIIFLASYRDLFFLPKPWGEEYDTDMPFKVKYSKVSHFLHIVQLWVSANEYLLQKEASFKGWVMLSLSCFIVVFI